MDFSASQMERYSRQLLLREVGGAGQARLLSGAVLLVGVGRIGSPVALYLAGAGVGHLRIADPALMLDPDVPARPLHQVGRSSLTRAASAVVSLRELNPEVEVIPVAARIDADNVATALADCQVVVDTSGDRATQELLNRHCQGAGLPLLSSWSSGFNGWVASSWAGVAPDAPCLACGFATLPPVHPAGETPEYQPLAAVTPGVIGCLVATEAIKALLGGSTPPGWIRFDARAATFHAVEVTRAPACPVCGHG